MKVIFLDIDGVLNSYDGLIKRGGQGIMDIYYEHETILAWVLRHTQAKIVISSTWRVTHSMEKLKAAFHISSIPDSIIGATPICRGENLMRGQEIERFFLGIHSTRTENFVIIDDDNDMPPYMDKLVLTDNDRGLTYENGLEIIRRLNGDGYADKFIWTREKT